MEEKELLIKSEIHPFKKYIQKLVEGNKNIYCLSFDDSSDEKSLKKCFKQIEESEIEGSLIVIIVNSPEEYIGNKGDTIYFSGFVMDGDPSKLFIGEKVNLKLGNSHGKRDVIVKARVEDRSDEGNYFIHFQIKPKVNLLISSYVNLFSGEHSMTLCEIIPSNNLENNKK